jgi:hypothetical protein
MRQPSYRHKIKLRLFPKRLFIGIWQQRPNQALLPENFTSFTQGLGNVKNRTTVPSVKTMPTPAHSPQKPMQPQNGRPITPGTAKAMDFLLGNAQTILAEAAPGQGRKGPLTSCMGDK